MDIEKIPDQSQLHCLNCGTPVSSSYCHHCGQRVRDNLDRSLGRLLGEFLGNIFFLDNRFFVSLIYFLRFPGRMTVEFLGGKRKKFISPVTLFLFFNLVYFFVNPLSDYSLPLSDQVYGQPYSTWTKEWVDKKLKNEGLSMQEYAITYQNMSDQISKSVMILNIPIIALFVYLITFRKRKFYFDNLIYSFHFFSLYMLSWIMLSWVGSLGELLSLDPDTMLGGIRFELFVWFIPLLYAILSIRNFMNIRWYWSIPAGLGAMTAVLISNLIYRFLIFIITFWLT
ncbi:DUF3667 domain-containing protein [Ekhidna sp.]